VKTALADPDVAEGQARGIVETLAKCMQASLMRRYSDAAAADAFVDSRLGDDGLRSFGTLGKTFDTRAIVDRAALRP
jgi:putative acyl-CoA dehydrogenase